jgi:hypothetical protein
MYVPTSVTILVDKNPLNVAFLSFGMFLFVKSLIP